MSGVRHHVSGVSCLVSSFDALQYLGSFSNSERYRTANLNILTYSGRNRHLTMDIIMSWVSQDTETYMYSSFLIRLEGCLGQSRGLCNNALLVVFHLLMDSRLDKKYIHKYNRIYALFFFYK